MSAYALPGSFFLPGATTTSPSSARKQTAAAASSPTSSTEKDVSSQKEAVENTSDACSAESANAISDSSISGRLRGAGSGLIVAVRSASVDPIRLIQGLARGGGGQLPSPGDGSSSSAAAGRGNARSSMRRRRSRESLQNPSSSAGSAESSKLPPLASSSSCSSGTDHDDAIQFHLSINFNGRTYTAMRTLPRFVQLRNDILREIAGRYPGEQPLSGRQKKKGMPPNPDTQAGYDTESSDEGEVQDASVNVDISLIPELPIGEEGTTAPAPGGGAVSFAGRGFTRLQALMNHYCPAMEGWLRTVADMVPPEMSPSLTDFLWEPLGATSNDEANEAVSTEEGREDVRNACPEGNSPVDKDMQFDAATLCRPPRSPSGGKKGRIKTRSCSNHSVFTLGSIEEDGESAEKGD
mmetsp:Transcript_12353/g.36280  ORF Transcript_12353/g.36280 Transcript_12353/m.36280 type:complete len:409 (-) Transcript_12353:1644-2870(-)